MAYTDAELIAILKSKARKLKRPPRRREIRQADTIRARFGTFTAGLKAAGLQPSRKRYTREELTDFARQWRAKHGRPPKYKEFNQDPSLPNGKTCIGAFGTWNRFLTAAGLAVNVQYNDRPHASKDELLTLFRKEYKRIQPRSREAFDRHRGRKMPHSDYFCKQLGLTWNKLLLKIGVPKEELHFQALPEPDLIAEIRRVAQKIGHAPSGPEFDALATVVDSKTLRTRFNGWNRALAAAGLQPAHATPAAVTETRAELVALYKDFSERIGKGRGGASAKDLNASDAIYDAAIFVVRFGSLNSLRQAAGMDPGRDFPSKYTREEVAATLRETGRLTNREIGAHPDLPCVSTILRLFRTTRMAKVWEKIEKQSILRAHSQRKPVERA